MNYITDERYKQAVLIDGEWGTGKTFFVKEKLLVDLKREIKDKKILYIPLYGINDLSQIIDEINSILIDEMLEKKLSEGKVEIAKKGINFTSKLVTMGLKYFNIEKEDLPKLSDFKQINNAIIIFDDLERCDIEINQILGFINNMVEHTDIKVIVVANQTEIGKTGFSRDLPAKYAVVLNDRLRIKNNEQFNKLRERMNEGKKQEGLLDKKELLLRTEELFAEDIQYKRIKEKLIGLTIYYKSDLNEIYEPILEKYIKNEMTKEKLIQYKKDVLSIFESYKHNNIRTFIFGIMAYEKMVIVLESISCESDIFLNEHYFRILKYTMIESIRIKTGQETFCWKNRDSKIGITYWKTSDTSESTIGYEFIDTYLLYGFMDIDTVKMEIENNIKEKKMMEERKKEQDSLSYNKLYSWWELEDDELSMALESLKKELQEGKYTPNYFRDMILIFLQLEYQGFKDIPIQEYVQLMKEKLQEKECVFDKKYLELPSNDPETCKKYKCLVQPLWEILDEKDRKLREEENKFLNQIGLGEEDFALQCEKNRGQYMTDKKFLFYLDLDVIIPQLKEASVKKLTEFWDGLKIVYNFSNLNDYFRNDAENIEKILEQMNVEEWSQGKVTKRIALNKIKEKLEKTLVLINQ